MSRRKPPDVWIVWYRLAVTWHACEPCMSLAQAKVIVNALERQNMNKGGVETFIRAYRELAGVS